MKYRDLVKQLRTLGWYLKRQGGSHEIWTNGEKVESIPRHQEINEITARTILKRAKESKK
ncbi:MAG: type II toxin-antitoxin system HicA family toxin [Deltaproteobacteria bacterium]|nr:type II toxin-antitoxin system HicA family toxin [Deltaproteobacteria bacterium]